jgi:hypothetical protein
MSLSLIIRPFVNHPFMLTFCDSTRKKLFILNIRSSSHLLPARAALSRDAPSADIEKERTQARRKSDIAANLNAGEALHVLVVVFPVHRAAQPKFTLIIGAH